MLKLERLSFDVKEEKGTKKILSNINLTVDDGKFVVVTGPNGGGKSTLAKLIAGIESPASGSIFMEGHDITDMSISERAKNRGAEVKWLSSNALTFEDNDGILTRVRKK